MPDISQMKESKFLKRADCGAGILLTIESCSQMNVGKENEPDMKWCLNFVEDAKPMVLNSTNAEIIAKLSGLTNSDDWSGVKIVAYDDPNVSYGGKLVGGIRVRAPKTKSATSKPAPAIQPKHVELAEEGDDDVPFN